ncbi:MAG: mRNA surveillance protein pelota [Candidatus Lokiarchaeota archaeon]|nr:mRNA surveillance protein pelota [Candidatus Lokiarchaeota archaeon]
MCKIEFRSWISYLRILEIDEKNEIISVRAEDLNDLWTLYNVIDKNDEVSARTQRRIVLKEGSKGERKQMHLKLNVESVSFHEFTNRLRVKGTILEGPEDFVTFGTYHTFNIEPGQKLSIKKEKWLKSEIKRLKKASIFESDFNMVIVAIETGLATIALITNFSHNRIATIKKNIPGKRYEQSFRNKAIEEFFLDISKVLNENLKRVNTKALVICGPGNTKERFGQFFKEKSLIPNLPKTYFVQASSGTESAILETMKSKELKNLKEHVKVILETEKIEDIMQLFSTNSDLIAIGFNEISNAIEKGAIKELFCVDVLIRGVSKEEKLQIEQILNGVEKIGGEIHILSSEHPTGQQIIDLGSLVAILRYKI